ncbi:hypothetical protein CCAX7_10600 [Capsulimonas corticalis]|uniref:alpha-L-fucosidase n=1 Tax=Capsulimonas corticalis TaxID=2219043 RepID=A0A402CUK6_9BACT|nr:alpha-L-fucosidase [Capsulimonas corticalis]BDI29009.1 hypothetical protein CCAX7_10600 [Capsulimonas corticalis]
MKRRIASSLLTAALLACSLASAPAQTPQFKISSDTGETQAQFAKRTEWWRQDKFGLFIHWGIYDIANEDHRNADPDKLGEWSLVYNQTPVAEYEKYAPQFNPTQFSAKEWVGLAKAAGMKYVVFTAKHHDGFCLFDSKLTDYTIVKATPFHRDPLKELAEECKKQGMKLCIYYSYMDWRHPDYLPRRPWDKRPTDGASLDKYTDYAEGQLRELLTNYGKVSILWFDGGWEHPPADERALEIMKLVRKLQPGILIDDRMYPAGDYATPEQSIPANAMPNGRLWEACMTTVTAHNLHWSYAWTDHDFKPTSDLVRKVADIAGKGGNFLLDIGPDSHGVIRPEDITHLREVGAWMKVNGESIYGVTKSPFRRLPFAGSCTQKGDTLYLHVSEWPASGLTVLGLKTPIKKAYALATRQALATAVLPDGTLAIQKPDKIDPSSTVIVLKCAGLPDVDVTKAPLSPEADGYKLSVLDADLYGDLMDVEKVGGEPNVGEWIHTTDKVCWTIAVPEAKTGKYHISMEYSCPPDCVGTDFEVSAGEGPGETVQSVTKEGTGDWYTYHTMTLDNPITLTPGTKILRIQPKTMPHYAFINLRKVVLTPANP